MNSLASNLSIERLRKGVAKNSVAVLTTTMAVTNLVRLVSNLILTRLLAPEAFGVVGVVLAINYILQMTTDMGFGAYIVRAETWPDRRRLNVIWTVRVIRNLLLALLMFAFAGPLAAAFDKPMLVDPIRVTSLLVILQGIVSLHPYMAQRAQRISYITIVQFAGFLAQIVLTILIALFIRSYWAMILGLLAGAAVTVIFSYTLFPGGLHRFAFDRTIGAELWRYSRVIVPSSIITVILLQADKIFIGRALSLDVFGLYMLAVNLTMAGQRLLHAYVNKIIFPLYAETHRSRPEKLFSVYYSARRRMTMLLAFMLGGAAGGGELLVRILLDDRYLGSGVFVSLLCFGSLFLLVTKPAESLLFAMGRIRSTLEGNVLRLAWIAVAAPLGFHFYGVIGLVAAFALIELAAAFFWWGRLIVRGVFDLREELYWIAAAMLGGAIGFAAQWQVNSLIASGRIPAF